MDIQAYLKAPVPRWLAIVAVTATGLAAAGSTYYGMKKRYDELFDMAVANEIENAEKFLSARSTKTYSSPMEAMGALVEEEIEVDDVKKLVVVESYITTNADGDVIEVAEGVWTDAKDYDLEFEIDEERKHNGKPYIISHDDFFNSENQMITLTWFEGDETLADEKDEHIPDIDRVIGEDNLLRFGYGSQDPNILFVRNEKMEIDFEIVKNDGKYVEQVLGFIQHDVGGNRKRVLRMRDYDDD